MQTGFSQAVCRGKGSEHTCHWTNVRIKGRSMPVDSARLAVKWSGKKVDTLKK